jgi:hypothetical protein
MADIQQVMTASGAVVSGRGILAGIIASIEASASRGTVTAYDNTAGSGTIIFQVEVFSEQAPFVLFFADQYAPRFGTGLYLAMDAGLVVNVWASER